jgi:predicted nucleotidyltransferase
MTGMISDEKVQAELEALTKTIVKTVPTEQVILFGSYAYGKPHKDSDLDVFVVLKDEYPERDLEATFKIGKAFMERQKMPLDLLVHKQHDWNILKGQPGIENIIAKKGLVIYANTRI